MLDVLAQLRGQPAGSTNPDLLVFGINLISIGLLLALLIIFIGTWRKTKAPFTLGLVIFVGVLLLEDLVRVRRVAGIGLNSPGLVVLPEFLELIALAVLLYLATR
ncbi:MAG TPA: hypothetical protein VGR28_00510 [Candidatus Thermoplasmatota archaeon]|jgi:hypothetical protein|nr:hypothetical protein [Candidatus Thermoplasmatota archaeon]